MKKGSVLFLIIFVLITILATRCGSKKEYLAKVDERPIYTDQFIKRYKGILSKISVSDNFELRKSILSQMVNELMLIKQAEKIGLRSDSLGRIKIKKIKNQSLIDLYMKNHIFSQITISEAELKNYFVRLNTKIRARHIFAPTQEEADSLYKLISNCKYSFDEIAEKSFNDPVLKANGGDLGYFSAGDMDPWFEDVAFKSEIGRISRPVKTAVGYSIIKVEDKVTNPLLTEDMYNKSRSKIYNYILFRKKRMLLRTYSDSISNFLNIKYNPKALDLIYNFIKNKHINNIHENGKHVISGDPFITWKDDLSPKEKDLVLATSKIGKYDIEWFFEKSGIITERKRNWIKSKESLIEFVNGLIIREFLIKKAIRLKFNKTVDYHNLVKKRVENYLLDRINEFLLESNPIPEDTLKRFYFSNGELFIEPPAISISKITLNDKVLAGVVKKLLDAGKNFEEIAKKYSEDKVSGTNGGYIGIFRYNDLGQFADDLFELGDGEWAGPFFINGSYYFFKCNYKVPKRILDYEEARELVYKTLKPFWREKILKNYLASLRSDINVEVNWEKLKGINIKQMVKNAS